MTKPWLEIKFTDGYALALIVWGGGTIILLIIFLLSILVPRVSG